MIRHSIELARNSTLPLIPGILFCLIIVFAAHYISLQYGSPLILTSVLLGMAFNNLSTLPDFQPGLDYCTKAILRTGVALLGIRITFDQIGSLGLFPLALVITCVASTLLFSLIIGRFLGVTRFMALLAGMAVSICGVSAAMALLAILPARKASDNAVACTLMAVTCISTLAMILYPALITRLGMPPELMGLFLGTTIHDVAQAIGAGEMISAQVAETTIYTKMLRVSLLMPALIVIGLFINCKQEQPLTIKSRFPAFLLVFVALVFVNNTMTLPHLLSTSMASLSQLLLLMAMAALGTKTNLINLLNIDKKPLALVALNTGFIAGLSLLLISL